MRGVGVRVVGQGGLGFLCVLGGMQQGGGDAHREGWGGGLAGVGPACSIPFLSENPLRT